MIDFNKYLKIVSEGLEHLDTGEKAIVENIIIEVEELSKGTDEIIKDMKKYPEQGRTIVVEMQKLLSTTKSSSSTISTTSTINSAKLYPSQTIKAKQPG